MLLPYFSVPCHQEGGDRVAPMKDAAQGGGATGLSHVKLNFIDRKWLTEVSTTRSDYHLYALGSSPTCLSLLSVGCSGVAHLLSVGPDMHGGLFLNLLVFYKTTAQFTQDRSTVAV